MAENLEIPKGADRKVIYTSLVPQIQSLIEDEDDLVANLANITAIIKEAFGFLWVGFYWVKDNQLVLGPFQGPLACTRIALDRGVCGHAYQNQKTIVVNDVEQFPGHIACSSLSRSEVVVPIFNQGNNVIGVLDIDSSILQDFNDTDKQGLEAIIQVLERKLHGDCL